MSSGKRLSYGLRKKCEIVSLNRAVNMCKTNLLFGVLTAARYKTKLTRFLGKNFGRNWNKL